MKVNEIIFKIKNIIEGNLDLRDIWVEGQLSEPRFYPNSIYFNIKDEEADSVLGCFVGKHYYYKVINKIDWKDGIRLKIYGYVSVWNKSGTFKFIVQEVEKEDGLGQKFIELEKLKQKLLLEGLFDAKHKKRIPRYAQKIGIITSLQGAAIHDIYKTMKNNGAFLEVIIFPSLVQGDSAPECLINALLEADQWGLDLLIITRGGGSFEDLYCFNDEQLVRTIFQLQTPIISAVGHETDMTLCDLVADLRASTPTQSVNELPNFNQEDEQLLALKEQLIHNFYDRIRKNQTELLNYNQFINLKIQTLKQQNLDLLNSLANEIKLQIHNQIQWNKNSLSTLPSQMADLLEISIHQSQNQLNTLQNEIKNLLSSIIAESKKELNFFQENLNIYQFFKDLKSEENYLHQTQNQLQNILENTLTSEKLFIDNQINNINYFMQNIFHWETQELNNLTIDLKRIITDLLNFEKDQLKTLYLELQNHDHQKILEKGYSITLKDGNLICSVNQVKEGDTIQTVLKDGNIDSIIKKV